MCYCLDCSIEDRQRFLNGLSNIRKFILNTQRSSQSHTVLMIWIFLQILYLCNYPWQQYLFRNRKTEAWLKVSTKMNYVDVSEIRSVSICGRTAKSFTLTNIDRTIQCLKWKSDPLASSRLSTPSLEILSHRDTLLTCRFQPVFARLHEPAVFLHID